jgi:hypothetical protein
MSQQFLDNSAQQDANDLSSVVQPGGHWCICAWAFAAAVQRDPQTLEGIELDCDRTNNKLRAVYEHYVEQGEPLQSPSGRAYEAQTALQAVERLCGSTAAAEGGAEAVMRVQGMKQDLRREQKLDKKVHGRVDTSLQGHPVPKHHHSHAQKRFEHAAPPPAA